MSAVHPLMSVSIRDAASVGYDQLRPGELAIGDLVTVGHRYVMAEHPPFIGNGKLETDAYTDTSWRIVAIRKSGMEIGLADPRLEGVDESDEYVDMPLRRLIKVNPREGKLLKCLDAINATRR
jgi:hypothetical protein